MPFSHLLDMALAQRDREAQAERAAGDSLEAILDRHLLAVEATADDLLTSVLLLDDEGRHLLHGAAPSMPKAFCDAIHGQEIGPGRGSCGTAAYLGHAVYVTDIATNPLWADFRELALEHGLRACWSTPIDAAPGRVIGTFAIYHHLPRGPTVEERTSIHLIMGHVADAILASRAPA
ncbi:MULTISPECIES: GAF domain-containing protein [unclassified Caulobacter]|uniref:GAF domain-containing protein n=1 Tax=unclassified Caulobacter TaxID=2648921 RepID=UPI0004A6DACF|nr:GAF domain-containing protein [Caulobacter sp. UNC358MFTsu5.1]